MIPRVGGNSRSTREQASAGAGSAAATAPAERAERAGSTTVPVPSGLDEILADEGEGRAPVVLEQPVTGEQTGESVGGRPWDPVPVPLPTYVTKPEAPRREPKPITGPTAAAAEPSAGDPVDELVDVSEAPRQRSETLGLPLEQILARRRAAG